MGQARRPGGVLRRLRGAHGRRGAAHRRPSLRSALLPPRSAGRAHRRGRVARARRVRAAGRPRRGPRRALRPGLVRMGVSGGGGARCRAGKEATRRPAHRTDAALREIRHVRPRDGRRAVRHARADDPRPGDHRDAPAAGAGDARARQRRDGRRGRLVDLARRDSPRGLHVDPPAPARRRDESRLAAVLVQLALPARRAARCPVEGGGAAPARRPGPLRVVREVRA